MQERCHVHKKEKKVTHNLLKESLRFHLESSSEQTFHEEFPWRPHWKEMLEKKKKNVRKAARLRFSLEVTPCGAASDGSIGERDRKERKRREVRLQRSH